MCDMPADGVRNTLVLRLWPVSEVNGNPTSVIGTLGDFAGVGPLWRAGQRQ